MNAYLVEHARRELVRRYRANPRLWPDGIDGVPYRGHEHEWSDDGTRIGAANKPAP